MRSEDGVLIECASCAMRYSDHCADCVVTALLSADPRRNRVVVDADEERALRELAGAGLIPQIRYKPRDRTA